jgi:hypothetical protein
MDGGFKGELGKTLAGNSCKKCIAKGEPCHLHWTVRTVSVEPVTTSTIVKTTRESVCSDYDSDQVQWLDVIPTPALYMVLLYLEPNTLNFICGVCRRAFTVSCLPRFREEYLKTRKLRNLIQGHLRLHSEMRGPYQGTGKIFVDESNNKVWVFWRYQKLKKVIFQHHNSEVGIECDVDTDYICMKKMRWEKITAMSMIMPYTQTSREEITDLLFKISRPNWYPGYLGYFKNKNQKRRVINEFIAQIEPCIKGATCPF